MSIVGGGPFGFYQAGGGTIRVIAFDDLVIVAEADPVQVVVPDSEIKVDAVGGETIITIPGG